MERRAAAVKLPSLPVVMRTTDDYEECARRLKALADPDRLRIVHCLMSGPKNVSRISAELSEDLVKVSHHLGVLRNAAVVQTEKAGKFVIYRLDPAITGDSLGDTNTLDLGCCRLDLPRPDAEA